MLRTSSKSYVCWRCAFQRVTSPVASKSDATFLPRINQPLWKRTLATAQHYNLSGNDPLAQLRALEEQDGKGNKIPIRERLRKWEEENQDEVKTILSDYADTGELSNSFTRPQNVSMGTFDVAAPLFDGDELGDLRSDDAILRPGDMVELSSEGSRRPMLAICLGRYHGYDHYYTSSGKWFVGLGVKSLFVVQKFVSPAELEPVLKELPTGAVPLEALNALQDLGHGPSRTAGAKLLRKMLNFAHDAEAVYQGNAGTLDASSAFIGDPLKHRYLTLHEITELLLPESYQKDGKFEPVALYAVHRSLLQDEVFFRPLRQTGHRRSYLFEISPLSEVQIIQKVESLVRDYLEIDVGLREGKKDGPSPVHSFIKNARKLIDQSRETRLWTESGIIGPSKVKATSAKASAPATHQWSPTDLEILQFMELWSSYQKFPSYSRLQCFGSTILRALDRYQDAGGYSVSTGWTFLQEVGWIPSWEIPARYNIRFPGVEIKRGGGYVRPYYGNLDRHIKGDILAPMRKPWKLTAYCIDSETTMDIDDAVSIEKSSNPNQFWIHIHVADPASSIQAETPVAKYAELIPETIYLPGHFERMLPQNIGPDRFSLAPGRPCLTFSALVDKDGHVLDRKITPGILEDVVYMTDGDVASVIEDHREHPATGQEDEVIIGPIPKAKTPPRQMTRPQHLSEDQKSDLALLSELGKAIHGHRLKKGATPFFHPRPEAMAYFDHLPQHEIDNFTALTGDPSIRIGYSKRSATDLVENAMRLAGEIAAKWCHERGIPIPFRTQPHATQNIDKVQQYTRDVFYPLLRAGIRPDDNQWRYLWTLTGNDELTTTAGPYFTLGVDMYTKATSPLRRFSDLIVHWQIEAALLKEHTSGTSLSGNKSDDSFLPFSRKQLDRMLPMIRVREKQARALIRGEGGDQWILQALVRAWRFGEAKIPETFQFTVLHVNGRRSAQGRLDWFERTALLRTETLNDVIRMAEVRVGDVYEVKLHNVNVHTNKVYVEAVKVLKKVGEEEIIVPEGNKAEVVEA
ncbi:RNB-domain-containing protein [Daldinia loculata]|uniref:RNB-domain-containing protein n=1 Tax=Daldinia loculata TaxID=103429 RepID=UPI0020C5016E|nr:RNB-domain-containing protein [Daldinia loculata]KAI1649787.1 RNB-domain-containing protein [Daldinia loculata]KAI2784761.1 RNB-domain-containing protein [Daldinia loculata]